MVEARANALKSAVLSWPAAGGAKEPAVVDALVAQGASRRPNGLLLDAAEAPRAAAALTASGLGPVTASRPDFLFEVGSPAYEALARNI